MLSLHNEYFVLLKTEVIQRMLYDLITYIFSINTINANSKYKIRKLQHYYYKK